MPFNRDFRSRFVLPCVSAYRRAKIRQSFAGFSLHETAIRRRRVLMKRDQRSPGSRRPGFYNWVGISRRSITERPTGKPTEVPA